MDKVLSREDFGLELFVVSRRISIIAQKVEAIDKLKASHEALRERVAELEEALSQIERGCSFPEDDVQKTIVRVARAALEAHNTVPAEYMRKTLKGMQP